MLLIRERMPLRLAASITAPNGQTNRWGYDERRPENTLEGLSFSDTVPGGFEQAQATLTRNPEYDYSDLAEFSNLRFEGVGGQCAWEGRLESSPRVSGDQMAITPGAVGWQAALDDVQTARAIFLDVDLSHWKGMSVQRQLNLLAASSVIIGDASSSPDSDSGYASLATSVTGAWSGPTVTEGWYDSKGLAIRALYYAWKKGATVDSSGASPWWWTAGVAEDDIATGATTFGNLIGAGPGSDSYAVPAGVLSQMAALVQFQWTGTAAGSEGALYPIYWTGLGVVGQAGEGLISGNWGYTAGTIGVRASDAVRYIVNAFAGRLRTVRAGQGTIEQTGFLIPQLAFLDSTTASAMIKEALKYEMMDWWVDEGPTFHLASPQNHGRRWRARTGPAKLQTVGPQVDKIWNGVVVSYTDVTGVTLSVGPSNSGALSADNTLYDPDPANPATAAGVTRYATVQMGTTTRDGAIRVGQMFLYQSRLLNRAGQATLTGHVEDEHGVLWPAWLIRAGDWISFVDAHDASPRKVIKKSWDDSTKTASISLDSPPDGLTELLQRMSIALVGTGFS